MLYNSIDAFPVELPEMSEGTTWSFYTGVTLQFFFVFSLTGTVDCILVLKPFTDTGIRVLVFRKSGPFIESCHLGIKFNGFLVLETNGLVSLRERILSEVSIDVKCLFRRGTAAFVVMVVVTATIRRVATVTIIVTLACFRRRTAASWRLTTGQAVVVVVIYTMGVMVTASSVL